MSQNFSDSSLLLVGHGSSHNAQSSAPAFQHGEELRRRKIFAEVLECFWKQTPTIAEAVQRIRVNSGRIFIVPLFISEGYFTEQAIPQALGLRDSGQNDFDLPLVQRRGEQLLYYCAPVGTHQRMTEVLLARAREVVAQHPFPRPPKPSEIALFMAGHGTQINENSRKAVERQVDLIRQRSDYAEVYPVFIEEEPLIGDCYKLAQAKNIVIVPFLISEGQHGSEDIPVLLGEPEAAVQERKGKGQPTWRNPTERRGKRVWYASSVGSEPLLADVIVERVVEASRWPVV